jgi:methylenetetrahydrofolate dehydrogenase (NADP+) / methenyltetrahydrofolate cyclohydrolase
MTEATIINGKAFAEKLRKQIAEQVSVLKNRHKLTPGLAVILVGEDPASQVYVKNKSLQVSEAGMNSFQFTLPAETTQKNLITKIESLNNDPKVHGILVQLPLPKHIDEYAVINTVSPAKDVDGFNVQNVGKLVTGQKDALVACTPIGCVLLLKHILGDLSGLKAVVIGRSNIVGKPIAHLLLQENCTVTIAHSKTRNLAEECRQADIVIAAVGIAELVKGSWIKPGAVVIDVGINRVTLPDGKTRLLGDVAFEEVKQVARAVTPVPGGVGPMTIACLLRNTVKAACDQRNIPVPEMESL